MAIGISDLASHAKDQHIEESEINRRVAIKSAYYAMYHTALEAVNRGGGIEENDKGAWGVHAEVAKAFRRIGTSPDNSPEVQQKSRRATRLLMDARDMRVLACYQLEEDISVNQARDTIHRLDRFVEAAEIIVPECSSRDHTSGTP